MLSICFITAISNIYSRSCSSQFASVGEHKTNSVTPLNNIRLSEVSQSAEVEQNCFDNDLEMEGIL